MVLVRQRTKLKNRIHANLAKYGLKTDGVTDLFGVRGRQILAERLKELPLQTRYATQMLMEELDHVHKRIEELEGRMAELFAETKALELIKTLPGLGFVLAVVILTEVGDVGRFPARVTLPRTRG